MFLRGAKIISNNSQITLLQRDSSNIPAWIPSLIHFYSDSPTKKGKAAPLQERKMRDRVRLNVKGGDGGKGCWSFRRTRTDRFGKPDGGSGGRGGDVILECTSAVWDFSNLQHHLNAKKGGHGESKSRIGSRGSDKVVQVPVGTVVHLVSGEIPSFVVEDRSVQSFQPWEIPDFDQEVNSLSPKSEISLSSLSFSDKEEATNDSPSQYSTDCVRKSAQSNYKISEITNWDEKEGKSNVKYLLSGVRSSCRGIKVVKYDSDTSESEFEEEATNDSTKLLLKGKIRKSKTGRSFPHIRTNNRGMKAVEYDLATCEDDSANHSPSLKPEEEATNDSSKLQSKGRVRKSKFRHSFPRIRTNNRGMKAIEYDLATYESESEDDSANHSPSLNPEEKKNFYDEEHEEEYNEDAKEEEEEVQYSVAELTKPGQRLVIAHGGEGGIGNATLKTLPKSKVIKKSKITKDKNNIAIDSPEDENENSSLTTGIPGSESVLILELKSIADVGLVGMPNAGKSTLLGAVSRAKPTVGHYAFTTLRPNIGNLNYDDYFSMTVADIPGLIKGAHANRGLGHAFLRHIERTKVLAYVVDLAAALNGGKGIAPWEQLRDLVLELEYHQEGLSNKPSLIVANKIDEEGAENVYEELKKRVKGVPIYPVCAVLEEGVPELKDGLRRLMDGSETQSLGLDRIMVD